MDQADHKVVLITGASRGIGRGIASMMAGLGYRVIGTSRSQAGADGITKDLAKFDLPGQGVVMNMNDVSSFKTILKSITDSVGQISILINNAGITDDNLFMRMKADQFEDVIQTNLTSNYYLMKECIRPMVKQRWGRIINISSVVAFSGSLGQANYCAAKAGQVGMSKSIALEVARYGITVNCIAPGFIETEMTGELDEKVQQGYLDSIPMRRMGQIEDIANAAVFLASDSSSYITGTVIHVNGGLY